MYSQYYFFLTEIFKLLKFQHHCRRPYNAQFSTRSYLFSYRFSSVSPNKLWKFCLLNWTLSFCGQGPCVILAANVISTSHWSIDLNSLIINCHFIHYYKIYLWIIAPIGHLALCKCFGKCQWGRYELSLLFKKIIMYIIWSRSSCRVWRW